MKNLLFGLIAIAAMTPLSTIAQRPQAPPANTEVYFEDLGPAEGAFMTPEVINISNNPDYDNQPSFTPDGRSILFASVRNGAKSDIYRYDIETRALTQLTHTPEAEYSPLVTPDGKGFSVIRVEADNTQRLWRFDLDGTNPRLVLENIKPVGYHVWIDDTHLALFVLGVGGQPNTLQIADTTTGTAKVVDQNIGRTLLLRPGGKIVTYVSKAGGQPWFVRALTNATAGSAMGLASLGDTEDFTWDPSVPTGGILVGHESRIDEFVPPAQTEGVEVIPMAPASALVKPPAGTWHTIANFSSGHITKISRLTASAAYDGHLRIAFVAEPVK